MRVALLIEYDGTPYAGWQWQPNGLSVQQCLEEAIQKVSGQFSRIHGAGRTDAGVHALGQVAHFDTQASIPAEKWCLALNPQLPETIRVKASAAVDTDFHARFDACGKHYRYVYYQARVPSALLAHHAWHIPRPMDHQAMQAACEAFCGTHDFAAFCASGSDAVDTVRTVHEASLTSRGPWLLLDVQGQGFLYNMVRILAGTLMEVGTGKRQPTCVIEALASGRRELAGVTAPAHGLHMMAVEYKKNPFESAEWPE